jgi:hypothetical protein
MDAGPWLTSPKHVDGEPWAGQRPVAVVLDPRDAPQPLTLNPDELPVDLHRARVEVDFGPGDGQRLTDPNTGRQHPPGEVRQVLAHCLRVGVQGSEPTVPFISGQLAAPLSTATVRAVITRWAWAGSGTPSSDLGFRAGTRPALGPSEGGCSRVVARMTAPGGWCVEPVVVQRAGRTLRRLGVTRMGVFVGEVADPRHLAKLGVPVAELFEQNYAVAPRRGSR